jgi:DNA-binding LytR/AlgR family response regulator
MSDPRYIKQLDIHHTGMVFTFVKKGNEFVHTNIEGQLVYNLGYTPSDIIGKTLTELFPGEYAEMKFNYYSDAWAGNIIHYQSIINGIQYIAYLRPIKEGGKVVEVIGSCINVTEQTELQKSMSIKNNSKPIFLTSLTEEKLYNALQTAADLINHTSKQANNAERRNLTIKENNNIIFIPVSEIIFIERVDRKSLIHTNNKRFETYEALTCLHQQLNENFIRCHKSYILNTDYLEVIEQRGQKYFAHFRDYDMEARISINLVKLLKMYKSN